QTLRDLGFPSFVILRPVFVMENLLSPMFLNGDTLVTALDPETSLQMVAVKDIGKVGARAFTHAEEMNGSEIDFAGDAVTMQAAAKVVSSILGRPITYSRIPIEAVRENSEDFALMLEWFDKVGYDVDIEGVASRFGVPMTRLTDWARDHAAQA
ncbi:MAG: NmrA family NAD(P)-binding protein, partial [Deltaproteobacteria bacterium]|nr:NmrA family NAD(P)-binding protein [Deltaproteobacteria bacterium]